MFCSTCGNVEGKVVEILTCETCEARCRFQFSPGRRAKHSLGTTGAVSLSLGGSVPGQARPRRSGTRVHYHANARVPTQQRGECDLTPKDHIFEIWLVRAHHVHQEGHA